MDGARVGGDSAAVVDGGANLDAVLTREQAAQFEQVVEVVGVDAVEPGELLHGLCVRAVGDSHVVEGTPDHLGLAGVRELGAADEAVAAFGQKLHEAAVPVVRGRALLRCDLLPLRLVTGEQDQVLGHTNASSGGWSMLDTSMTGEACPIR